MKKNNNYTPHLPEEEINKLVQELTDPRLSPVPYSPNRAKELTDKVAGVVKELMSEYNHKVVKIIEQERQEAFQKGLAEGKKHAKK